MHSRVENWKWFVINWLLAVGDISPVVFRLIMLRLLTSYIEMNLRLCTCLSKRVFIRSLFIIKVAVSRMDGLVVSYYRFMVDLMMKRCIVFIMNGLVRHKRVISLLRKNDCLRMSFREIERIGFVMLNCLVVRWLKMSGFMIIGFLRSSCNMLSHHLLAVMLNTFAQLFLHIVFITYVVLVIVVLAFEFLNCVSIVMGFRGVLSM